jgi:hypothetical protein
LFLNAFPIAPSILSHMVAWSSIVMYRNWKVGCWGCFYFALGGPKRCFHWGNAQCSKKIADEPMNMALSKTKKKTKNYEHIHELINMNHIKDHISYQRLYQHFWLINRSMIQELADPQMQSIESVLETPSRKWPCLLHSNLK